mmetsp:Transcript_10017/g.24059  ORF Transcript_10017/g.24059 Transcript_10017/m.24059 type:complete len:92 (-) Transcript_10017:56-331(-)
MRCREARAAPILVHTTAKYAGKMQLKIRFVSILRQKYCTTSFTPTKSMGAPIEGKAPAVYAQETSCAKTKKSFWPKQNANPHHKSAFKCRA